MNAVFEIPLTPLRGDGRLTEHDVRIALDALPHGVEVAVRIDECDDFEASAPPLLARELSGHVVRHHFGPNARRVAADWLATYDRAAAAYLAVEAARLDRGA